MRSAQPTPLRAPWCKEHTIYNAEHTSLQPTTLRSPWCKSIQYTTPAMHPSTRHRWGHLDTRTHSMRDTKCVPCTRHRISSALFCQPTPVYRPTRNFYKTLVSDDWLGIIIVQLCLILLACSASFDFTFCPLRGSAGRAEPFKFTSGDGTSIDDGWSEAVVNKRSVWTLRRLRDEEETKKRCLSLYKGPAPERPTFCRCASFFALIFGPCFSGIWIDSGCLVGSISGVFSWFLHAFFEHVFCIDFS